MPADHTCQRCNAKIRAEDRMQGMCPSCLLELGLREDSLVVVTGHGAPAAPPPTPEELAPLFPQFEILEILGQGGMGVVYKARQKDLDRLIALKVLPTSLGREPAFAERFTREAKALASLNHPNLVAVYSFGKAGEHFWFAMEFVDGINLRQRLKAEPVDPTRSLEIVRSICEALAYAHNQGVVHRDIKPENILVDKQGRVKITDFGLAKVLGPAGDRDHLTMTHQAMGTPIYMAPEQLERPGQVDHRADIFSLGVVFYELLTGELPLGRFPVPSQKIQVDVGFDEVVLKALEKEPDRRYQTVGAVRDDVAGLGERRTAPSVQPVSSKREEPKLRQYSSSSRESRATGTQVLIGLGCLMAVLMFLALFVLPFGYFFGSQEPQRVLMEALPVGPHEDLTIITGELIDAAESAMPKPGNGPKVSSAAMAYQLLPERRTWGGGSTRLITTDIEIGPSSQDALRVKASYELEGGEPLQAFEELKQAYIGALGSERWDLAEKQAGASLLLCTDHEWSVDPSLLEDTESQNSSGESDQLSQKQVGALARLASRRWTHVSSTELPGPDSREVEHEFHLQPVTVATNDPLGAVFQEQRDAQAKVRHLVRELENASMGSYVKSLVVRFPHLDESRQSAILTTKLLVTLAPRPRFSEGELVMSSYGSAAIQFRELADVLHSQWTPRGEIALLPGKLSLRGQKTVGEVQGRLDFDMAGGESGDRFGLHGALLEELEERFGGAGFDVGSTSQAGDRLQAVGVRFQSDARPSETLPRTTRALNGARAFNDVLEGDEFGWTFASHEAQKVRRGVAGKNVRGHVVTYERGGSRTDLDINALLGDFSPEGDLEAMQRYADERTRVAEAWASEAALDSLTAADVLLKRIEEADTESVVREIQLALPKTVPLEIAPQRLTVQGFDPRTKLVLTVLEYVD